MESISNNRGFITVPIMIIIGALLIGAIIYIGSENGGNISETVNESQTQPSEVLPLKLLPTLNQQVDQKIEKGEVQLPQFDEDNSLESERISLQKSASSENKYLIGSQWFCNNGYKVVGDSCQKIFIPENAYAIGSQWFCNYGFKKAGETCQKDPMGGVPGALLSTFSSELEYCEDAVRKCRSYCGYDVYDYDSGEYLYSTDADSNCEDSCKRGLRACEDEYDRSNGCWEFKRKCQSECSDEVYDYDSGEYIYNTDAQGQCEDACHSGYRWCE